MGHNALPAVTKHMASRDNTSMQCISGQRKEGGNTQTHTQRVQQHASNKNSHRKYRSMGTMQAPARVHGQRHEQSRPATHFSQTRVQHSSCQLAAPPYAVHEMCSIGLVRVGHCRACLTSRHSIQCLGHATSCVTPRRQPSAPTHQTLCCSRARHAPSQISQNVASTKHERRGHREHWQQPKDEVGNTCTCARSKPPHDRHLSDNHTARDQWVAWKHHTTASLLVSRKQQQQQHTTSSGPLLRSCVVCTRADCCEEHITAASALYASRHMAQPYKSRQNGNPHNQQGHA